MIVDLHVHTTCSDGSYTPEQIVALAHKQGLSLVALTDHDEYCAYDQVKEIPKDLVLLRGAEFSSTYKHRDVHILAYGYDIGCEKLVNYVQFYKTERRSRIKKMTERCAANGYKVSYEELVQQFGETTSLGRPHLSRLLIQKGYVKTISQAFETILSPQSPCYVPKFSASPADVVTLIHDAGGFAVLAHPVLIRNDTYVKELLDLPFDGVEVYHPKQQGQLEKKYLAMAQERGLLVSGGSDFHGVPDRYPQTLGEFKIPLKPLLPLLQALALPEDILDWAQEAR